MKKLLLLSISGCGTITQSHLHHMSNQALELRRYQLARVVARGAWGNAYDDLKDDREELEEIEQEMMRRGLINPSTKPQNIKPTDIDWGNPHPPYQ